MTDSDSVQRWEEILAYQSDQCYRGIPEATLERSLIRNSLCGDQVKLGISLGKQGIIELARFEAEGCIVSQAAAAILCEYIENKSLDEIRNLDAQQMLCIFGAPLTATRQRCGLLAWEALQVILHR